jgi:hypothetical protein
MSPGGLLSTATGASVFVGLDVGESVVLALGPVDAEGACEHDTARVTNAKTAAPFPRTSALPVIYASTRYASPTWPS